MMYCIAVIVDEKGKELGFRLLDTKLIGQANTEKVKNFPVKTVLDRLKVDPKAVANLSVKDGKVVGSNGVLDRYTKISADNQLVSEPRMVILFRTDSGFIVTDGFGNVTSVNEKGALELNKKAPVANGKIVTKDGKEFISSIVGEYPFIEAKKKAEVKQSEILYISNSDTIAQMVEKLEKHLKDSSYRIIGKLDYEKSFEFLSRLFVMNGLGEYSETGDPKQLEAGIKYLKENGIPALKRICDKKAIYEYAQGINEVTKGMSSADALADMTIALGNELKNDKVKFS